MVFIIVLAPLSTIFQLYRGGQFCCLLFYYLFTWWYLTPFSTIFQLYRGGQLHCLLFYTSWQVEHLYASLQDCVSSCVVTCHPHLLCSAICLWRNGNPVLDNFELIDFAFMKRSSCSWSYDSWIYNYLCNRCEFESRSGEVYSRQHYVIKFVRDLPPKLQVYIVLLKCINSQWCN